MNVQVEIREEKNSVDYYIKKIYFVINQDRIMFRKMLRPFGDIWKHKNAFHETLIRTLWRRRYVHAWHRNFVRLKYKKSSWWLLKQHEREQTHTNTSLQFDPWKINLTCHRARRGLARYLFKDGKKVHPRYLRHDEIELRIKRQVSIERERKGIRRKSDDWEKKREKSEPTTITNLWQNIF